jgi:hypothetical protein
VLDEVKCNCARTTYYDQNRGQVSTQASVAVSLTGHSRRRLTDARLAQQRKYDGRGSVQSLSARHQIGSAECAVYRDNHLVLAETVSQCSIVCLHKSRSHIHTIKLRPHRTDGRIYITERHYNARERKKSCCLPREERKLGSAQNPSRPQSILVSII